MRSIEILSAACAICLFSVAIPGLAAPSVLDQAIAAYKSGQYARAMSDLDSYLKEPQANLTSAHYYMGLCCQSLNQISRAMTEYRWVVSNGNDQYLKNYAQTALNQLSHYDGHRTYQGQASMARGQTARASTSLPGARGTPQGRPLVLDFWASWCSWCRKSTPWSIRHARSFPGKWTLRRWT